MDIVIAVLGLAKNALPPTAPLAAAGARAATRPGAAAARQAPETERLAIDMVREEAIVRNVRRRDKCAHQSPAQTLLPFFLAVPLPRPGSHATLDPRSAACHITPHRTSLLVRYEYYFMNIRTRTYDYHKEILYQ